MIIMSLSWFRVCAHTQPPDQNGWRNEHRTAFIASFIAKLQRAPRNWTAAFATWFNYTHTQLSAAIYPVKYAQKWEKFKIKNKQVSGYICVWESLSAPVCCWIQWVVTRNWPICCLIRQKERKNGRQLVSNSIMTVIGRCSIIRGPRIHADWDAHEPHEYRPDEVNKTHKFYTYRCEIIIKNKTNKRLSKIKSVDIFSTQNFS